MDYKTHIARQLLAKNPKTKATFHLQSFDDHANVSIKILDGRHKFKFELVVPTMRDAEELMEGLCG